jgi:hypothetical protein
MELLESVLGGMSHYFPGKDYIYLVDRLGTRLLKDLYTEISIFRLKPSALRIRDSLSLAQKQNMISNVS